jgi:hypothetical protein
VVVEAIPVGPVTVTTPPLPQPPKHEVTIISEVVQTVTIAVVPLSVFVLVTGQTVVVEYVVKVVVSTGDDEVHQRGATAPATVELARANRVKNAFILIEYV